MQRFRSVALWSLFLCLSIPAGSSRAGETATASKPGFEKEKLVSLVRKAAEPRSRTPSVLGDVDWKNDPLSVRRVARKLDRTRLSVSFKQTSLPEALETLRRLAGVPFILSARVKKALKKKEPRVDLQVTRLRLADILDLIAVETGSYRFKVKAGAVLVLTKEEYRPRLVLRIYNVADIIRPRRDFRAPHLGSSLKSRDR